MLRVSENPAERYKQTAALLPEATAKVADLNGWFSSQEQKAFSNA
jgi:hypothetical protein